MQSASELLNQDGNQDGFEFEEGYTEEYRIDLLEEYLSMLKAQKSLHEFARQSWPQLEPEKPYADGWHIGAICEHLEAVTRNEIQNLIINIPPRCMKSNLVSVMWPAWVWLTRPSAQFLCASHALSISVRDSIACRRLVGSRWYKRRWGELFSLVGDQNTKLRFQNDRNGHRIATSVGGASTGENGDFLICDDPNNAKDGESEKKRERANNWFGQEFSLRLNDRRRGGRVVIQQRLHENDVSGYWMEHDYGKSVIRLILPMEFEKNRKAKTIVLPSTNGKTWEDPRKKDGELLWPERMGPKEVEGLKRDLVNQYKISGQLQQSPSPGDGGIIKKSWFQWWKQPKLPKVLQIIQSWDTALEDKEENSYSACTTWGLFEDDKKITHLILLGLWRGRAQYPELRVMAQRLNRDYRDDGSTDITPDGKHAASMVLVEAKASGAPLIQDLRRAGVIAFGFNPGRYGDKTERVQLVTHLIEGGKVWVHAQAPNYTSLTLAAHTLVELCGGFPKAESRDVVDSMTQVLLRLMSGGYIQHPKDQYEEEERSGPSHGFYGVISD